MGAGGSTNTFARISMLSRDFAFLTVLLSNIVEFVQKYEMGEFGFAGGAAQAYARCA
jgi:hypothetical protein